MEPEILLVRTAYGILLIALALMTWAYSVGATSPQSDPIQAVPLVSTRSSFGRGSGGLMAKDEINSPSLLDEPSPCTFNPLCACSTSSPGGFGDVYCYDVPFANIPKQLNYSRAHTLYMRGNNLQIVADRSLVRSGLVSLQIQDNNLYHIEDDAFDGLSKTLAELNLEKNKLTKIPTAPLRQLQQLQILNLNHNKITDIDRTDFSSWPSSKSVVCLGLSGNMIVSIPEDAFENLPGLEILDLSGNSIQTIDSQAFNLKSRSLKDIYLQDNLLKRIPFESLYSLNLDELDLSHNLISSTFDPMTSGNDVSVGELDLSHNQIDILPPLSFQNFKSVNKISLAYNPIFTLENDAFRNSKIREIDLSHCYLFEIQPNAFKGLEKTLSSLDLRFNNLTNIHQQLLDNFDGLVKLNLDENPLQISLIEFEEIIHMTLHELSILGNTNYPIFIEDIGEMRNLVSLNISNLGTTSLNTDFFEGFNQAVEHVKISQSKITSINAGAFSDLRGVKILDISDNKISRIDNDAFKNIGPLMTLKACNALKMSSVAPKILENLKDVRELDLSSNGLSSLPDDSFMKNGELLYLNLRFNKLTALGRYVFDATRVPRLQRLFLSFNKITQIKEATFSRLRKLEHIELNENSITKILSNAFNELINLRILNLAGNKISELSDKAFTKLSRLQLLDLSHNKLTSFNFNALELIGTKSSFRINLSHNKIQKLSSELPQNTPGGSGTGNLPENNNFAGTEKSDAISNSNIQSLILSHNNISYIAPQYFSPISSTMLDLDLSFNSLQNLTKDHLSGMRMIEKLELSHNDITTLGYDTFIECNSIQVVNLSYNEIKDIPKILFEGCSDLRVFSASNNKIRTLHETIFSRTRLEILDMKNNYLSTFPGTTLTKITDTLVRVDVSGNWISSLSASQFECLKNLRWLSLANNQINFIAQETFDHLKSLVYLDLSGNLLATVSPRLFLHIRYSLLELHVANMSLDALPDFDNFPHLSTLNLSFNNLSSIPINFGVNTSALRTLDISSNQIRSSPVDIWRYMARLTELKMHSNPIRALANDSFLDLDHLHILDISDLPLETVQVGTLTPLTSLEKLILGPLPAEINPGSLIYSAETLQHVYLKMDDPIMTNELSMYPLPEKLTTFTLEGETLQNISPEAFKEMENRDIKLILEDTKLSELSASVLQNLGAATHISLEIHGNNSALRKIANPSPKYRPKPFSTYLMSLTLDDDVKLACSCDSGWIEFWLRQWIEKTCPVVSTTPHEDILSCEEKLRSLRTLKCGDKPDTHLTEAFVNELECGWENSPSTSIHLNHFSYQQIFVSLVMIFIRPLIAA